MKPPPELHLAPNRLAEHKDLFEALLVEQRKVIVGQEHLVRRLLIGLLCGGHLLIEGVPGLAKTLAVKTLADTIDASFHRIQCTPDLLPADLIGTLVYDAHEARFTPHLGPVFTDLLLVDEINRAPAKVQSALLEAMQERQVSIGGRRTPSAPSSWCWRRRTPSSTMVRTRCPKRRSTDSCSRSS